MFAMRMFAIPKSDILDQDHTKVAGLIDISSDEVRGGRMIWPWTMTVSGYDDDPRELSEIPEVRNWFREVHKGFPFFAIYLAEFSLNQYILSQLEAEVYAKNDDGTDYAVDENDLNMLFAEISIAAIDHLTGLGIRKDLRQFIVDAAFERIYASLIK